MACSLFINSYFLCSRHCWSQWRLLFSPKDLIHKTYQGNNEYSSLDKISICNIHLYPSFLSSGENALRYCRELAAFFMYSSFPLFILSCILHFFNLFLFFIFLFLQLYIMHYIISFSLLSSSVWSPIPGAWLPVWSQRIQNKPVLPAPWSGYILRLFRNCAPSRVFPGWLSTRYTAFRHCIPQYMYSCPLCSTLILNHL